MVCLCDSGERSSGAPLGFRLLKGMVGSRVDDPAVQAQANALIKAIAEVWGHSALSGVTLYLGG